MDRRHFLTQTSTETIAALSSAAAVAFGAEPEQFPAPVGRDIVLGMSVAFKGPSRGWGIELYRGSMAYLEQVNRTGGIEGRRIVIKAYDDGYNPLPAIDNTVRLIEKDDPLHLYGYVGTPTVTRILPLLKLYSTRSMYLFSPFTGACLREYEDTEIGLAACRKIVEAARWDDQGPQFPRARLLLHRHLASPPTERNRPT